MSSSRVAVLAGLMFLGSVAAAAAQDRVIIVPSDPSDRSGPSEAGRARPAEPVAPDLDGQDQSAARSPAGERDRDRDEDLERARAAARAADPRLQGLERAREAARKADPSGGKDCLSSREARGAITAKRAVTLSQAVRTARDAWDGEVIDYKLCTYDGALAYDLTLLNADGRVARARVDASNGKLVGVR